MSAFTGCPAFAGHDEAEVVAIDITPRDLLPFGER
jgi:hypothetical protein